MGKWDKLINRIMRLDKSLRFEELSKALDAMGYRPSQPRGGGSHITFRKPGKYPITIPKGNPVNTVYIELVRDAVDLFESETDDDD